MNDILNLMKELTEAFGPSGFEDDVIEIVRKRTEFIDNQKDSINNLYFGLEKIDCKKPIVALDCHIDEVGFMIEHINDNGTMSFIPLGGWHIPNIVSNSVVIKSSSGEFVKGVIGSKPPHFMTEEDRKKLPILQDLYIDIGTRKKEETQKVFGISVGDPVVPDVNFRYDERTKSICAKAIDNRVGALCIIKILEYFKNKKLDVNLVGIMSAQEEVGMRGASVAVNKVKPDLIIVFEGSPADDTFYFGERTHGAIGNGTQLRIIDGGMITNPRLSRYTIDIAKKNKIAHQIIVREKGSTNGAVYHKSNLGIPCVVLGIATRYAHSHYCYASYDDIIASLDIAKELIKSLNKEKIANF
ncbi:M42 family peptidase [Brachyspira aalborgi]|uniref:M42 family peptidase n=1 Tax=Brachyspira aalborgi TaxID=29522 RepID=A0AB38Q0U7_9SPIR|nr:M42 family metallopeptidase [Brachyspira aalborgi]TXJ16205.1 M42 family peptidase [Brachyspira aalborgi]TXJ21836.1 M42 family peptidase [Brachyspira aalborgi]TXJ26502.1 M42 family peptidase [Brachyspira aalborgi]TXJ49449.1 M42 family peptidase [Brachyspira aalborgi]